MGHTLEATSRCNLQITPLAIPPIVVFFLFCTSQTRQLDGLQKICASTCLNRTWWGVNRQDNFRTESGSELVLGYPYPNLMNLMDKDIQIQSGAPNTV
jgi:hypothetical protein